MTHLGACLGDDRSLSGRVGSSRSQCDRQPARNQRQPEGDGRNAANKSDPDKRIHCPTPSPSPAPREPANGLGVPVAGVVHSDHAEHVI